MKLLQAAADSLRASVFPNPRDEFFLKPFFLHWLCASCHLLLLVALSLEWFLKRYSKRSSSNEARKENDGFLYYKATLSACLILCLFHVFLFVFAEELVAQMDLGVRAMAWLCISAYLHYSFFPCGEERLPAVLRVWWGIILVISCSSLALNLFFFRNMGPLGINVWALDLGSLLSALMSSMWLVRPLPLTVQGCLCDRHKSFKRSDLLRNRHPLLPCDKQLLLCFSKHPLLLRRH